MSYATTHAEQFNDGHLLTQPLLTADEAAELLNVPRSTVYELVRSRGLPHVRIGERGMRFTRAGLEEWVASHTYGRP
jgi:excisionase family DNA binding protein